MTILKNGSRGEKVKELQTALNRAGCKPVLIVDGIFGAKTEVAVRYFQTREGLVVDGLVGDATWKKLTEPDYEAIGKAFMQALEDIEDRDSVSGLLSLL